MTAVNLEQALIHAIHRLNQQQQQQLLAFIDVMVPPEEPMKPGDPRALLSLAGTLPSADAQEMLQIIEEGTKIDYDEW